MSGALLVNPEVVGGLQSMAALLCAVELVLELPPPDTRRFRFSLSSPTNSYESS